MTGQVRNPSHGREHRARQARASVLSSRLRRGRVARLAALRTTLMVAWSHEDEPLLEAPPAVEMPLYSFWNQQDDAPDGPQSFVRAVGEGGEGAAVTSVGLPSKMRLEQPPRRDAFPQAQTHSSAGDPDTSAAADGERGSARDAESPAPAPPVEGLLLASARALDSVGELVMPRRADSEGGGSEADANAVDGASVERVDLETMRALEKIGWRREVDELTGGTCFVHTRALFPLPSEPQEGCKCRRWQLRDGSTL